MRLFLVGLMGAGKSTIGRQLSQKLALPFIDADKELEARLGVTIPQIFALEGEAGFRQREADLLAELTLREPIIYATGGGAVLREENRLNLKTRGTVVYLQADPEDLWHRTKYDRNRPLLQNTDAKQRLIDFHTLRHPFYAEVAHITLNTGRESSREVLYTLLAQLVERGLIPDIDYANPNR